MSDPDSTVFRGPLVTFALVSVPVTAVYLSYFPLESLGTALFWSIATTVVLATPVYGLVRDWRTRQTGNRTRLDRLLLGRDRRDAGRWLLGALALSVAAFGAAALIFPDRLVVGRRMSALGVGVEFVAGLAGLFAALAAIHAYRNEGLLVGWALVFGPTVAVWGVVFGLPLNPDLSGQVASMGFPILLGVASAVVLGTGGFLLGIAARRLLRPARVEESPA